MFIVSGYSQTNLVINPGFEEGEQLSIGTRELRKVGYLTNYWYSPIDKQSPQLFKQPDRGIAKANSGIAAVGMKLGGAKKGKSKNEYLTGELSAPLVKGQVYCVSFNMLLHRSSKWASSDIGLLFHRDHKIIANTEDLESLSASLYANDGGFVQNTKWQEYNGYFIANGGEKFISFGVFGTSESIEVKQLGQDTYFQIDGYQDDAFYQVDDFSVVAKYDSIDCGCATPPILENEEVVNDLELKPYLFALDASGSMLKEGVFDSLRQNLKELLMQLPLGTPVTFSTFSSNSDLLYSGKIDKNTPHYVDSVLALVKLGGGTSVYNGLSMAARSWITEVKDSSRIVLISDGAFTVSSKVERIVKDQYENKGRLLTIIQVDGSAKGIERLAPYRVNYMATSASELRSAIFQIYKQKSLGAVTCECIDAYSDTMNYHFVIDYSGSMSKNINRAIKAVSSLYEKVPHTAVVSITAFSQKSTELYVGKRSEMSVDELESLLESHIVKGGTDPTPGVKDALEIMKDKSLNRFGHLIIITDLKAEKLNENAVMKGSIMVAMDEIDLAVSSIAVDLGTSLDMMESGRAQFDASTGIFRDVNRLKFEKDLFDTRRSGCDYTTQPYHYNPTKDAVKEESKKVLKAILKELSKSGGVSF